MNALTMFTAYLVFVASAAAIVAYLSLERRAAVLTITALTGVLAYAALLGSTGVVERSDMFPPGIALLAVPLVVAVLLATLTGAGRVLASQIALPLLLGFQVFRFGVELTLHHLSSIGLAPRMMTLEGGNIEILVAATAPVAAWLVTRGKVGRNIAWTWNLVGLLSLGNIVGRAVLSSPGPLQFLNSEVPDVAILIYPFTFIPGFMVPLALALHVLTFRAFASQSAHAAR